MSRGATREGEAPPAPEPLAVPVLDSHCHLDLVGTDVAEQLAAARAVGVPIVVQVGIDAETSQLSAAIAGEHEGLWAAVAMHPNEAGAGASTPEALAEIERLAGLPQVVAVGETGLDHFRTPPEGQGQQEESFRAHIDIAKRTGTALVIHDRDAHDDVLRVLLEEGAPERVVFHCFSGDEAMARVCAERGYFLSYAGNVTFKNADDLRAAARVTPRELLLVETDAPFLTPTPWRGRPNASYLIPVTMRALADLQGVHVDELCGDVMANGKRAFALA